MKCQANGNPKNFTFSWMKNNLTFTDFSHVQTRQGEDSSFGKTNQILV